MNHTLLRGAGACAALALCTASPAWADDEALPVARLVTAIQTAVAANPGQVREVDVERERGRVVVEVTIQGADNRKHEVKVDVEQNQVVR